MRGLFCFILLLVSTISVNASDFKDNLKAAEKGDLTEKIKVARLYQMQCGSFRKQDDAESLMAKIVFQGLNSEVRKTADWYRVILGPYEHKSSAEKDRHKLQRAKIDGCQIWLWRAL